MNSSSASDQYAYRQHHQLSFDQNSAMENQHHIPQQLLHNNNHQSIYGFQPSLAFPPALHHTIAGLPQTSVSSSSANSLCKNGDLSNFGEVNEICTQSSDNAERSAVKQQGDQQQQRQPKKRGPKKKPLTKEREVRLKNRRYRANTRERNRMHGLNHALESLRRHVPTFSTSQRLSKIETLRLAKNYIRALGDLLGSEDPVDPLKMALTLTEGLSQNTTNLVAGTLKVSPRTLLQMQRTSASTSIDPEDDFSESIDEAHGDDEGKASWLEVNERGLTPVTTFHDNEYTHFQMNNNTNLYASGYFIPPSTALPHLQAAVQSEFELQQQQQHVLFENSSRIDGLLEDGYYSRNAHRYPPAPSTHLKFN